MSAPMLRRDLRPRLIVLHRRRPHGSGALLLQDIDVAMKPGSTPPASTVATRLLGAAARSACASASDEKMQQWALDLRVLRWRLVPLPSSKSGVDPWLLDPRLQDKDPRMLDQGRYPRMQDLDHDRRAGKSLAAAGARLRWPRWTTGRAC